MARADLLKKLFSSYVNEDKDLFLKTAHEIINDERKKNHSILADDLEMVLNGPKRFFRRSVSTFSSTIPTTDQNERLVEVIYPDKYFEDVTLPLGTIKKLEETIRQFQNWDILVSNGVSPANKLLFYGPPGCGKTLCANIIAAEAGLPLMYVRYDAVVSSYLGETASNLKTVFDLAKNDSFVILFDEFDAIGRTRNDSTEHGEIKRVVNTFLQQIDSFKGRSIIIAATNFEQSLDYAIWRRFDDTIRFDLPSNEEKIKAFACRMKPFHGPAHALQTFLPNTENFSYADIENVCKTIMRECILSGKRSYSKKDIENAVLKQKELVALRKTQY